MPQKFMNSNIKKIQKEVPVHEVVKTGTKSENFYVCSDGKEFMYLKDANSHQKSIDKKKLKEKEYKEFLKQFKIKRKTVDNYSLVSEYLLKGFSPWCSFHANQLPTLYSPVHNEPTQQWFFIENEKDKEEIKKYFFLFYNFNIEINAIYRKGWNLILLGYDNYDDHLGIEIISLEEYRDLIESLQENLPELEKSETKE